MFSIPMNCVHDIRTPFLWAQETVGVHRQRCYFQNARLWRCFHWARFARPWKSMVSEPSESRVPDQWESMVSERWESMVSARLHRAVRWRLCVAGGG